MGKKKKRKIKKNILVIFMILIITILVGGTYMLISNKNINTSPKSNTSNINKEETITTDIQQPKEKAPSNNQEFLSLENGEYLTEKGYTLTIKDNIAYIDNNLIVNKTYSLPESYTPQNPYTEVTSERCQNCIDKEVMAAFKLMQADASSIGLNIYISSGYRSYKYQETLYNNYTAVSGQTNADTYSARPGHSEHQTGLCFDLNTIDASFAYTEEGKWINNNAYLYGFIIRYPEGKEDITGYMYESWHLRYIGKDLAKTLYNNGDWITLEEYYGLTSSY